MLCWLLLEERRNNYNQESLFIATTYNRKKQLRSHPWAGPFSTSTMALLWLLVAVLGLITTANFNHIEDFFGNPPPLPASGVGLYQGVLNRTIPNYAMVAARDFSDRDKGSMGLMFVGVDDHINDGLWCQSTNTGNNIGSWQFPDGSAVSANINTLPVNMANATGQVGLLRVEGISSSPYQGMYTCTILDEDEINQTLVVWAAANAAYDGINENSVLNQMIISSPIFNFPNQSRDTDPPEFTLSFDVSIVPPTYVTCQVGSIPVNISILSRKVSTGEYIPSGTESPSPVTSVTVTLRTRQAGDYSCTVSVFRASGANLTDKASPSVSVTVTGKPVNFIATRTGSQTANTSWTAPTGSNPTVEGYEVFYETKSGVRTSGGTTTESQLSFTLTFLEPDISYTAFVVAFGGDLPSAHSNTADIPIDIGMTEPPPTTPTTTTPSLSMSTDGTTTQGKTEPLSETSTQGETKPPSEATAQGETKPPSEVTAQGETKPPSEATTQGETQPPAGTSSIPPIVGGIVVVLVLAIIIIVVVIITIMLMRHRSTTKNSDIGKQQQPVYFSNSPEKEDEVKVTTVPVIESFPSTMTVEEGQRVEFKVFVRGTPNPSYQWYHDDQLVEEDYAHEVTEEGSLILVTAEQKHSGTYKLVAENLAGVSEKSLTLIIIKEEGEDNSAPMAANGGSTSVPVQLSLDAIPAADFGQYVADQHAGNNKGFHKLYSSLTGREGEHPVTIAITPTNKPLNRFANITVYDDNRIFLKPIKDQSDCQGDYINASYINGYSLHHQYIATQGPMSKTLVDFWRLVWQEKPQIIIMVTNLKEGEKVKCQLYWPETGSQNYGPFHVTLADQQMFPDYTIRLLQVELPDSSEYPHRVSQFHFTSWPDHGVPDYATPILSLYRQIKQNHKPKRGPLLIHCSAGIGRTGTFIAIDTALEKIEKEGLVDISNIIIEMRQQRMKMVQTLDQFIFIYDAILEAITCGDTQIQATDLRPTLSKLRSVDPHVGKTGFQHQFDVLTQVTPNPAEVKHNIASQYPDLNRTLEFAPPDKHRVPLKGGHRDYISASFVNGYKQKKAFIIAQSPMENTCRDFWKMITERGCGVIVMLCHTQENGQETCAQYWPSVGDTKAIGEFFVEVEDEVEYPGFIERTLSVTEKESGNPCKVLQFHITNWESSGHCSNLQTIVSVQEEMYKVQRRTGNNPVVVHCSDTVSRSGMFCAIATAIDRCKTEGLVDVFQVIKAQRIQKPGLVLDVAQYELVFDAILVFLDSFETYTNFQ